MYPEKLQIRTFQASDAPALVEILQRNQQYGYPEVEGPEAMRRVAACDAAIFLVAEQAGRPVGFIKAVYDGSRALIHLLSVHPDVQHGGIGRALVEAVSTECVRRAQSQRDSHRAKRRILGETGLQNLAGFSHAERIHLKIFLRLS